MIEVLTYHIHTDEEAHLLDQNFVSKFFSMKLIMSFFDFRIFVHQLKTFVTFFP